MAGDIVRVRGSWGTHLAGPSFAAQGVFFHNVSKRSVPHIFKFIALILSVPCFHVSHFFFKRAYALQARQPKTLRPRVLSRRLGLDLQIVELLQPTGNRPTPSCPSRCL